MADIAVIGAGELGGSIADALARREAASRIQLVDDQGRAAEGKALDIMQSAPILGFSARVTGTTDLTACAGARAFVVADRMRGGEWSDEDGLMLLTRIARLGGRPVVIVAGASQRLLVERGVRELGYERERLFGSAPEALRAAVQALVAVESGGSSRDVSLTVLGVPPAHVFVPWEDATIGGFAATSVLDQPARRRLAARVAHLWPPAAYTLAMAAAKAVEALSGRSRAGIAAFVAPDDSAGRRARAAALPVRLGAGGIVRVELPALNGRDRVALENAMLL
jgi:malate dehydrogenase